MSGEATTRNRAYEFWERAGRPPGDGVEFWLRAEAERRYLRSVAHLPLPSAAQTADFAAHVLNARSWYKHVPHLGPDARVIAFLNPDAGMQLTIAPQGEVFRPLVTPEDCWHYSLMPTVEYRRRFGHWTYWAVHRASDDPPRYRDGVGNRFPVPDEVCDRCGCAAECLVGDRAAVTRAFAAARRWFASARADSSARAEDTARELLEKLTAADLVAIRGLDTAVTALAPRLAAVPPADVPAAVVRFLDASDAVDEVYTTDRELAAVVGRCLGLPREAARRPGAGESNFPHGSDPRTGWPRMNESDWLASPSPNLMLEFVRGAGSDRKLRLFACAYCRQVDPFLTPAGRAAVSVAEAFADGAATADELAAARTAARADVPDPWPALEDAAGDHAFGTTTPAHDHAHAAAAAVAAASESAYRAARDAVYHAGRGENGGDVPESEVPLERLLHDAFGNPFRPVAVDPSWLTSDVLALARGVYEGRAFDRMPVLADALEDAGCNDAQVLGHCRGHALHARGCWVLDLLLGTG